MSDEGGWIPIDGDEEDEPEVLFEDGTDLVEKVERHIHSHVALAMGAGLIPLPVVDALAVAAVQVEMILTMARWYGHEPREQMLRSVIGGVAGGGTAAGLASMVKLIPGVGSVTGGVAQVILSGASTYAIGKAFHAHFITGGSLNDLTAAWLKTKMKTYLQDGVKVAKRLRPSAIQRRLKKKGGNKVDRITALERLADLRDRGALSEHEFEAEKSKLLAGDE